MTQQKRPLMNTHLFTPKNIGKFVWRSLIISLTVIIALLITGFSLGVGMISAYVKEQPVLTKQDFQQKMDSLAQTSYAYFQDTSSGGSSPLIGALRYDSNREIIHHLNEVSPYLTSAFLAIEDHTFYEHDGIVISSIIRASMQHLLKTEVTTGGSTITQQLIKNVILNNQDQELERKAKEIVLALKMEQHFNKDEIIRSYLNSVYFGRGAHGRKMVGVHAAAKGIFGVNPSKLNLAQSAYIAGMVQRPNDYNPIGNQKNYQRGLKRMKLVLQQMLHYQKISKKEYQQALKFDIQQSLAKPTDFEYAYEKYPYIMFALETEAAKTLMKIDKLNIEQLKKKGTYTKTLEQYRQKAVTGGYQFYTTINQALYQSINQAATKGLFFHKKNVGNLETKEQIGATLIDNQTGAVLAFVSGSQDFSTNQKDHAFDVKRQPGSAIKPLLVYGPAIEEGVISPHSQIMDVPIPKSDGSGYYRNAGGNYHGPVTVSQALKWSYNIPAIKTFNALGHETGFHYLNQLNLSPNPKDGEASAIGGMTNGFTVANMSAAFATFANHGKYQSPYLIDKVVNAEGKVIWQHNHSGKQVFSAQTAYQITQMLKQVLHGTASYIGNQLPAGYAVAGKTGTTSDEKDVWFVGYTPKVTLGVWSGYDYNFPLPDNQFSKKVWLNIFKAAIKTSPNLFPKHLNFSSPGNLPAEICGFDCGKITSHYLQKRKSKEEQEKQTSPSPSSQLEEPAQPEEPELSEEPEQPVEPEPSEELEEPEPPQEPELPEEPEAPEEPEQPEAPTQPEEPTQPNNPS